ncbi:MAG: quinone-dependent dihydroorotate dehydrogenase [Oscillatoria sp. SIO1A7]|nr:quinone-dependent dihydroorotate dehydrogenase [Oscillatoria sp. SIO1A7]
MPWDIYKSAIRPIIFSGVKPEPEWWHDRSLQILGWLERERIKNRRASLENSNIENIKLEKELRVRGSRFSAANWVLSQLAQSYCLNDGRLETSLWGLHFPNPLGLAAGFDKNGLAAGVWPNLGFGFVELGSVTFHPQPGNPRPRMFRLPEDRAALNRMGFNNQGAAALAAKLSLSFDRRCDRSADKRQSRQSSDRQIPIGINLGKSKITPLEDAPRDYLASFRLLKEWGDYFAVNVSSPNTPGLRSLQDSQKLSQILETLQQENRGSKPILVKIAPDLEWEAIAEVVEVAKTYQLAGIIATNTTISRDALKTRAIALTGNSPKEEAGGISGEPLRDRSTAVIRFLWQQTRGQIPIIGIGGIFTAEDAWEKITAGASLLEIYTGLIYEGPLMVREILEGLLQKLEERGLNNLSDAVGLE